MSGLYELESSKRDILRTGFHHPKTGRPYPPENSRYQDSLRMLKGIDMAMEEHRIGAIRRI